jgi:hypothetical protein
MPHNDSAERTCAKPDSKCRERSQGACERRNLWKELRREYHGGSRAINEEIVPFDRGADSACQGNAARFYFAVSC